MQMDIGSGDHVKTWRYNTMKVGFISFWHPRLSQIHFRFLGMERQLGSQAHDDPARGRKHHLLLPLQRLQGRARVHRRLHLHVDAIEGKQPNAKRRDVPQAHRRMELKLSDRGRLTLSENSIYFLFSSLVKPAENIFKSEILTL